MPAPASASVSARARSDNLAATARQRAIAWLHSQQLPDGSFGQRRPNGSYAGSASATADVVYVLALNGEDPGGPAWTVGGQSALDALQKNSAEYARGDPGQAGKVARAVAASKRDPRSFGGLDLIAIIQGFYTSESGRYHPELLYRDTLAIEGLARAGVTVPPAAFDALLSARLPDGGWFWAFQGETADLDTTAHVLQVLALFDDMRCAPYLAPTADYLARQQDAAGGWGATTPPGPPNSNSTALAVAGLRSAGYDLQQGRWARGGRDPLASLLAFQEASGAFVYIAQPGREEVRLAATLDALTALASIQNTGVCGALYLPVRLAG